MGSREFGFGSGSQFGKKPFDRVVIDGRSYDLVHGEHPHSYSENNAYVVPTGEPPTAENAIAFDGHRLCWRVEVKESNYLKESELSGDQVRKACGCRIYLNDRLVYAFTHRTADSALLEAHRLLIVLSEHPLSPWLSEEIVGRRVYYGRVPAVVRLWFPDQGCVVIEAAEHHKFAPIVAFDPEPGESIEEPDAQDSIKVEVLNWNINWFREATHA